MRKRGYNPKLTFINDKNVEAKKNLWNQHTIIHGPPMEE